MTSSTSLAARHPKHFWVPVLILINLGLFATGLFTPVITLKQMIVFSDTFSIYLGIYLLFTENQKILALIIFVFSIVFPFAKLGLLSFVWFVPLKADDREKTLKGLEFLGKWSMTDVFVISLTIIAAKLSGFADARARYGIYIFAGAVIMSMLLTLYITKLAERSHPS